MPSQMIFFEILRDYGFPIACAIALLWFFLHWSKKQAAQTSAILSTFVAQQTNQLNAVSAQQTELLSNLSSSQSQQNRELTEQVTRLAKNADALQHAMQVNERLLIQNEKLVESIRSKEDAFIKLLQAINGGSSSDNGEGGKVRVDGRGAL